MRPDRRSLLLGVPGALLAACTSRAARAPARSGLGVDALERARGAARFIRKHAVSTKHGLAWRKSPDEGSQDADLYHGGAGPALFLLELHRATGDARGLKESVAGMKHIAATWTDNKMLAGFHGGIAGHAFVLHELARETADDSIAALRDEAIARVERLADPGPQGGLVYPASDILYGNAGVILVLLHVGGLRAQALAASLGDGLLGRAEATSGGTRWLMFPGDKRELPNFSHGTAGVAFALARLFEVTKEQRYLDAAIAGARHLLSIAYKAGDTCLIPHALPDGDERYYLAYCHGPAGTARLFHQLHAVTGDAEWAGWFRRSINGVLYSGVPEARTPGFWDNVGQCCGSAAIAELMLSLHRVTGDAGYLELARATAEDIARRAKLHSDGSIEWIHAENRNEPYWKQSYTGYMQGAAGIGSLFIRLAGHGRRRGWKVRFPDDPFPL